MAVTPTYNERKNLGELAEKIFNLGIENLELIVVDDNSPDGTGRLADELAKKYPIKVIHREKKMGLGTAYAAAFKYILSQNSPYIVQLDADLSHDPAVNPVMPEMVRLGIILESFWKVLLLRTQFKNILKRLYNATQFWTPKHF
jgi:dolichol-phosphate mannosyltransferase